MRHRAALVALSLALAAPRALAQTPPPPASEEDVKKSARDHLQQGQQFYEEEAFEAARAEFLRAYELSKSYKVLYNLALVTAQLNDFADAHRQYDRYLKEGGDEIPEVRREEVVKAMEKLKRRTALVEIALDVAGADITLDDRPIGKAPLPQPLMVNPGEHKIGASAAGHQPAVKHVSLTAGEALRVALVLPNAERSVVVAPAAAPTRRPVWPYWVPAAALAAGTAAFGALTLVAESDLDKMRAAPSPTNDPGALDDQASKTSTLALVTDILGVATLVGVGAGLFFTLRSSNADRPRARVDVRPSWLGLRGTF